MNFINLWQLIVGAVNDFLSINWSEIVYKKGSSVLGAATLIVAAFFTGLVIRWWLKRRSGSYYLTNLKTEKNHPVGIFFKLTRGLVWTLALTSLCFLGIALADPIIYIANTTEQIESREVVYLYDVSASNGFKISNTTTSRGKLSRDILERLIIKRKDKKDRAAYIVFATQSDIWSGFTTNFESLMFSIAASPLALAPAEAIKMWPGKFILKKGQFVETDTDQGTNLHLGLESAIYLFDRKGLPKITEELKQNPNAKMRSVVILTDGAADVDPEPQFIELKKRHIIPYLIFIDPSRQIEKDIYGVNDPKAQLPDKLLAMVRQYGGQYFWAKDEYSPDQVSESLDKLHGVKQLKKINVKEKEVYFMPLAIAVLFAISAMVMRMLLMRTWRNV